MKTLSYLVGLAFYTKFCLANWDYLEAAQINFYKDTECTQYHGETEVWYQPHDPPDVGSNNYDDADCFQLNMPSDSKSINTASIWALGTGPLLKHGRCRFYSDYHCTGAENAESVYSPGEGTCLCSRSNNGAGYLWKSARCYVVTS